MNEIILSNGRSQGKAMTEILQSDEYKKIIRASGISAEDMQYFAAKISAAFADTTKAPEQLTKVSELIRSAAQDLNKSLLKVRYNNANHVNPFYRKYQANGYIRKGSFR